MIIYEVNLTIKKTIFAAYMAWLKPHISQILKFPGFIKASMYKVHQEDTSQNIQLCVQYVISDQNKLDDYFNNHAPAMRKDALDKFADQFQVTRRVLMPYDEQSESIQT